MNERIKTGEVKYILESNIRIPEISGVQHVAPIFQLQWIFRVLPSQSLEKL